MSAQNRAPDSLCQGVEEVAVDLIAPATAPGKANPLHAFAVPLPPLRRVIAVRAPHCCLRTTIVPRAASTSHWHPAIVLLTVPVNRAEEEFSTDALSRS